MVSNIPHVHFGSAQEVNWKAADIGSDDDEEMAVTDPAVVAMLGFDPLDLKEEKIYQKYDPDQERDEGGRWADGGGGAEVALNSVGGTLPQSHVDAALAYAGGGSPDRNGYPKGLNAEKLNRSLRGKGELPSEIQEEGARLTRALDDAIASQGIQDVGEVYRGAGESVATATLLSVGIDPYSIGKISASELSSRMEGIEITDKGFVSTSKDVEVTHEFETVSAFLTTQFVINGKDVSAMDINAATNSKVAYPGEKEVLFARDTTFVVTSARVENRYPDRTGFPGKRLILEVNVKKATK